MPTGTTSAARPARTTTSTAGRVWAPLVLALGCAAAYAVFLLLPFYANHLNQYPPSEVASGLHDPKAMWPYDTSLGAGAFRLAGALTLVLGPLAATSALMWACALLWRRRADHDPRGLALLVLAATVALTPLVWLMSPAGVVVVQWWLD